MSPGYSGMSLAKKPGIAPGTPVSVRPTSAGFRDRLAPTRPGATVWVSWP
jgi:hypothetical protein